MQTAARPQLLTETMHPTLEGVSNTEVLNPIDVVSAYTDIYQKMCRGEVLDPIAASAKADTTLPKSRYGLSDGALAVMTTATAVHITGSVVPLLPIIGFEYARYRQRNTTINNHVVGFREPYVENWQQGNEKLSDALAGLPCLVWKAPEDGKVVIEVSCATESYSEQALERIQFLQETLLTAGLSSTLAGFLVPEKLARGMGSKDDRQLVSRFLSKAYKLRLGHSNNLAKVFVAKQEADAQKQEIEESRFETLCQHLRDIDPYHDVVRDIDRGVQNVTGLGLKAKLALEERLTVISSVRDSSGHSTGRKTQSSAMVTNALVMVTNPDGTPRIIPPSELAFDPDNPHKTVAGLEYEIYLESLKSTAVEYVDSSYVAPIEDQVTFYGTLLPNGDAQTRTINDLGRSKLEAELPRTGPEVTMGSHALRKAFAAAALTLLNIQILTIDTAPEMPYQRAALGAIKETFNYADDYLDEKITDLVDVLRLQDPKQSDIDKLKSLIAGEYTRPNTTLPSASVEGVENRAMWYLSSTSQDLSGYWDLGAYTSLTASRNGIVSWGNDDYVDRITSTSGLDFKDTIQTIPTLIEAQGEIESFKHIEVKASVVFNEDEIITDEDGVRWQRVEIPVKHGYQLVGGTVTVHTIGEGEDVQIKSFQADIRAWFGDGTGTSLFVKIPDTLTLPTKYAPTSYMDVTYRIGFSSQPIVRLNTLMPVHYTAETGAYDMSVLAAAEDILTDPQLTYKVSPINGKDTNADKTYDLRDVAAETKQTRFANCFTANTLLSVLNKDSLSPVRGFLLSQKDIDKDESVLPEGSAILASRDLHQYNVNAEGVIVDATPSGASQEDIDALSHPDLDATSNTPSLIDAMLEPEKLQRKNEQKLPETENPQSMNEQKLPEPVNMLAKLVMGLGVSIPIGFMALLGIDHRRRRIFLSSNPRYIRGGALTMLAHYKLDKSTVDQQILKQDVDHYKALPKPEDIVALEPKVLKKRLMEERRKAKVRYPYTRTEIARAVRLSKAARLLKTDSTR